MLHEHGREPLSAGSKWSLRLGKGGAWGVLYGYVHVRSWPCDVEIVHRDWIRALRFCVFSTCFRTAVLAASLVGSVTHVGDLQVV